MERKQLNVTIPEPVHRAAKTKAYSLGMTMNEWMESIIVKATAEPMPVAQEPEGTAAGAPIILREA